MQMMTKKGLYDMTTFLRMSSDTLTISYGKLFTLHLNVACLVEEREGE